MEADEQKNVLGPGDRDSHLQFAEKPQIVDSYLQEKLEAKLASKSSLPAVPHAAYRGQSGSRHRASTVKHLIQLKTPKRRVAVITTSLVVKYLSPVSNEGESLLVLYTISCLTQCFARA